MFSIIKPLPVKKATDVQWGKAVQRIIIDGVGEYQYGIMYYLHRKQLFSFFHRHGLKGGK